MDLDVRVNRGVLWSENNLSLWACSKWGDLVALAMAVCQKLAFPWHSVKSLLFMAGFSSVWRICSHSNTFIPMTCRSYKLQKCCYIKARMAFCMSWCLALFCCVLYRKCRRCRYMKNAPHGYFYFFQHIWTSKNRILIQIVLHIKVIYMNQCQKLTVYFHELNWQKCRVFIWKK